ncbi:MULTISPECIES: antitoxin [Acinetobacter]|uniref:antitoxin n=1 Tax=Acinetobacter TaxID=469 RepID=UPI0015D366E4|nr:MULTISPECIES: type II toxin-antitoxin system VapB family antitoxin [unclassified Acinetobacter]
MTTAKVFMTGRSQAIRLPKEFRFEGKEVEIFRRGDEVILREKPVTAEQLFKVLAQMPDDFYAETRVDEPPQEREEF